MNYHLIFALALGALVGCQDAVRSGQCGADSDCRSACEQEQRCSCSAQNRCVHDDEVDTGIPEEGAATYRLTGQLRWAAGSVSVGDYHLHGRGVVLSPSQIEQGGWSLTGSIRVGEQ